MDIAKDYEEKSIESSEGIYIDPEIFEVMENHDKLRKRSMKIILGVGLIPTIGGIIYLMGSVDYYRSTGDLLGTEEMLVISLLMFMIGFFILLLSYSPYDEY